MKIVLWPVRVGKDGGDVFILTSGRVAGNQSRLSVYTMMSLPKVERRVLDVFSRSKTRLDWMKSISRWMPRRCKCSE